MESTQPLTLSNLQDMQLLREWFQQSTNILTDFLELVAKVVVVYRDIQSFIYIVEHTQVPYNLEHIRASYIIAFQEIKQQVDDMQASMCSFPQEFDNCYDYLQQEPTSDVFSDLLGMLETTLRYYIARYEVLYDMFQENKTLALQSYQYSQQLPKPCREL